MPTRATGTSQGSGEDRRENRSLSLDPCIAVAELVERVCRARGGAKALAGTDVPVGYAQIRRWVADGGLLGLDDLLLMIRLAGPDDPFRLTLVEHLQEMFDPTPAQIAVDVCERVGRGAPIADAVQEALGLVQVYPGRWARVR
jgi:hypothetical protein